MTLSFHELKQIYSEAKEIYESGLSWEAKYQLIFSERISKRTTFSWCDPDASYEEDVTTYINGFDYYMGDEK